MAGAWEWDNETSCSIKCGGISGLTEELLASQEELRSMESVNIFVASSLLSRAITF